MPRGGFVGQALQITEQDRLAEPLGQSIDLLMDDLPELAAIHFVFRLRARHPDTSTLPLGRAPSGRLDLQSYGQAMSDAMEPVTQRLTLADRGRAAGEKQKRGLERILNVMWPLEYLTADPENPRRMTDHKGLEGCRVALVDKLSKQSIVRHPQEVRVGPQLLGRRNDRVSGR